MASACRKASFGAIWVLFEGGRMVLAPSCGNAHFDAKMHIFVEDLGFRVSGIDFTPFPNPGRHNRSQKWIPRAEKHVLVHFEWIWGVGGWSDVARERSVQTSRCGLEVD